MIPMGLSFLFLGVGFGLYATSQGFPWWTAPVLASTIFAGSMEFVTIGLLMAGFDPVNTFMLTLFVNGRHFFYGLSALQRYVHMGWKWFPTVAWMCDESFAINVSTKLPDDVDEKWFYFHVSWLNYIFWVVSTLVGGLFGDLLASVDLRGIVAMLLLTGKSLFMLASMGCMLVVCYIAYKWGGVRLD
ncbi:MAG: AzlC family ABC transporter permease [Veillonella sp.]|nr:AzlC family ABC transporter permease [Veillonella sp.]